MDDLALATDALRQNLDELETINTWLGGYAPVLNALERLKSRFPAGRPLRLADLGSGGGDTLRHVARWARKNSVAVELTGIDANAFMLEYATTKSRDYPEISYRQLDIFSPEFQAQRQRNSYFVMPARASSATQSGRRKARATDSGASCRTR